MLWDTHMHCFYSGDSKADPRDMILAAAAKGLGGICFTDHWDPDYPDEPDLFSLDLPAYYKGILSLRENAVLPVRWGIELGLQPHLKEVFSAATAEWPFDLVIGSSHVSNGRDPWYPSFFEGRSEREGYLEYFESILANILLDMDYDVYGHIDYVVRYGPNKNRDFSHSAYCDIIDEILRQLIVRGKGIELNTGGFRSGLGHPNPQEDILKRYRELGGEIITVGADAHAPEHVGFSFELVPEILKAAGFSYFTVFDKRKPTFIKL